jgi:hypothetical protein
MGENLSEVYFSIGDAAGHVYRLLEKKESNLANVKKTLKKSGFDSETVLMAIGWLAREEKLLMQKNGNICTIKLK